MFSRRMKQTILVGLLISWLLLPGCFPPVVQPTPIVVEPTVTIAPPATPVPTISPNPMAMPSLGEPLLLARGQIVDATFMPDASAAPGNLVAFEQFPSHEAGQLKVLIFDRKTRQVILTLHEYELAEWVSFETLLTSEAQYYTRLTQWNVRTGERTIGGGREIGDNVYTPGGLFYARPRTESPNDMRAIEVREWQTGNALAQAVYGTDIFRINWSPDAHWLAAQATDGTIKVWPVHVVDKVYL